MKECGIGMLAILRNGTYARLFAAQVVALVGTGLLTVALGLLAFDLAGGDAGLVLGTALTIKMVAYVGVAPVIQALTDRLPRKAVLVTADAVRALVALALPFITEAWQVYPLIFVLQAASATFTPAFQSTIPDVLPDERDYTRALSLSRLAYDLEALLSPALAAALLVAVRYNDLFLGTVAGFVASAALVVSTRLPARALGGAPLGFLTRLTLGVRTFWAARELRALVALNVVVAAGTAMVLVNTVVVVQGRLALGESEVALLLSAYGLGSMVVALLLPRLLDRHPDRGVMLLGALVVPALLTVVAVTLWLTPATAAALWALAPLWLLLGAAGSLLLTPSSRLLRRNSTAADRTAVFTAQFSLSHAAYIVAYPLAGVVGAWIGLAPIALVLAAVAATAAVVAWRTWR